MLHSLYQVRDYERNLWGPYWVKDVGDFPHGQEVKVAVVPKYPPDGDGYTVEVYTIACPARVLILRALPGENSVGEHRKGFQLSFGSGFYQEAYKVALYIREGTLVAEEFDEDLSETDKHLLRLALISLCTEREGEENTTEFYLNVRKVAMKLGFESDDLLTILAQAQRGE